MIKQNTWYKATPTYPTPRTVYTQQVKDAVKRGTLKMMVQGGYCHFYDMEDKYCKTEYPFGFYSCTKATARKKFKFEQL